MNESAGQVSDPRCPSCGHGLRRSRARTAQERFFRHVLRLRKHRCSSCGQTAWLLNDGVVPTHRFAARVRSRRDPVAIRASQKRLRRRALAAIVAIGGGTLLGLAYAHWYAV